MRYLLKCRTLVQAYEEVSGKLWPWIKEMLAAGDRVDLRVIARPRDGVDNKRLHAVLSRIAAQIPWAGEPRSVDCWKRLVIAAWLREKTKEAQELPSIDGDGVDIVFYPSSELSSEEVREVCEYASWWAAERGVDVSPKKGAAA